MSDLVKGIPFEQAATLVLEHVATVGDFPFPEEIKKRTKKGKYIDARVAFSYYMKEKLFFHESDICFFLKRDRVTILHNCKTFRNRLETNDSRALLYMRSFPTLNGRILELVKKNPLNPFDLTEENLNKHILSRIEEISKELSVLKSFFSSNSTQEAA